MERSFLLLSTLLLAFCSETQLYPDGKNGLHYCPHLIHRTFRGYVPRGNLSAGVYTEIETISKLKDCVLKCCLKEDCNVVLMMEEKCYHISCISNELCVPTLTLNPESIEHVSMVLVHPVGDETWEDVLSLQEFPSENHPRDFYSMPVDPQRLDSAYKDLVMDESTYNYVALASCNVGIDSTCLQNEICMQNYPKARAGTCKCKDGYLRNMDGDCVLNENEGLTDRVITLQNTSTAISKKHLTVTSESKEVRLPDSDVTLTATVAPTGGAGETKYQYEWTSLKQPDGSTAVKHQSDGGQLQLSKLSEGLYTFKVSVTTPDAYGETYVNVTVLPPSRINKPPQIVIIPANQTVKLPNTGAVLDASSSTDDDGIVSWHWELQQGPLGYQPQLKDSPTLQLNDLNMPGNYTFKLTVTDTDKATSSSTANITVLKITDYPPEANAGQDTIIYLPHNKITLNGNLSTDDHAITTWEWTKSPGDADKAVDMQDTRTPYLQLSNLEEGMYTFTLKVTDSANQTGTAEVHVFVKPPTNQPPVAEAGDNVTISLPQTWIGLDASKSTDDNKIVSFKWEQVEGPSTATFFNVNSSKTNVTGLTKGNYIFKVSVTDDNKNVASDLVYVTVNQNKNQKPTANAGGNFEVALPRNVVVVNGSKSSDDWAIKKWKWTRHDNSIALGKIVENSDNNPVLMLTDVVAGTYVFNLTVSDEQGLSDTDTVTFIVKRDPKLYYLVDITMDADAKHLTEAMYNTLKGKLALLVQDGTKLQVRNLRPEISTQKVVITFYVESTDGKPLQANQVVHHLRQKLRVDAGLLGFSVARLKTVVCQNNCSGHGVCNEQTRECVCEAFWMQDLFKVYFGYEEDSDCSWSILYVVLGVMCSLLTLAGLFWGLCYVCINWCSKRRITTKPTTYKLIEDTDDLPPFASRKNNISDSDTDSDVVFESRNKTASRFSGDSRNGHKPGRNGFVKMGRRVKT